ncbi:MAG: CTP synthase [Simkaniaceae bacterium]|nr:CTP synthase [Simkaniaceae bacterium]MCF7853118.1 CTP synthase [Simkaniaceae bacterium]
MHEKFIFVTGGVLSSLGKGLTAASIAKLLEGKGLKIAILKLDPYLNVDPGTMNPYEHGEVYVTDDGAETDLDLGHYYRYTNSPISKASNATSGQIYESVIKRERKGDYLGKTVQVIPHVTDEIKARIKNVCDHEKKIDIVLIEIGGTVGDIESQPFLEAIRQFRLENPRKCINIHLTYVPYLPSSGEVKSKPSQHSIQTLRSIGIIPDIVICRCEESLGEDIKDKIALFSSINRDCVFDLPDVENVYEVPLVLKKQRIEQTISHLLDLNKRACHIKSWEEMLAKQKKAHKPVRIGVIGKYLDHQDAYKSVMEALKHGAISNQAQLEIIPMEADKIKSDKDIKKCDGYLIPGGFGNRGIEGKIIAAHFARRHKIPYFGICLGMQIIVIEFARHVLKLTEAHSTEFDPSTPDPVISLLAEQKNKEFLGGTMRLGAYECKLNEKSLTYRAYHKKTIRERHRHRYEFNSEYTEAFEENGLLISGIEPKSKLCEIVEIKDHPWMVGVQYHPEFQSKPSAPHPLFKAFIQAALKNRKKK